MTSNLSAVLSGAVAMASFATTLFFVRFWRQTSDVFFLLFALAFAIDAVSRAALGLTHVSNEIEPMFYLLRLAMFALIIAAISVKNRSR
ncbi:hypothetical protein EAS56_35385 [Bradyrhizobium guangzhouense]|uniref:Uncharacterized protein n=2 Tax=Bradyrhizobium guangzhouense TaxID=1325095 RepID=A0AAE6CC04_9BRAD|nr:hypothetical protein XH91_17685 [Bradyrhizobium guangzhouense]RXH05683.1 hypothetical protein EAS56_35385 [Bradyrhizobium guangzhouense]